MKTTLSFETTEPHGTHGTHRYYFKANAEYDYDDGTWSLTVEGYEVPAIQLTKFKGDPTEYFLKKYAEYREWAYQREVDLNT
jgi:hypothetical protein